MPSQQSPTTDESDTGDDARDAGVAPLELDVVFEILKNPRRRQVVQQLRDHGETDLGDLAEFIAADENDTTVEALSADERKRVYIGLYQTHLPKMDDAGVVAYDQDQGVVAPGPAIDQLTAYLQADEPTEDVPADTTRATIDLSALQEPVSLSAGVLFAAFLVVGILGVASTALPGPTWAVVLVVGAALATWGVSWQ